MKPTLFISSLLLTCCTGSAALIYSNLGSSLNNFDGPGVLVTATSYQAFAMGFNTGNTSYFFDQLQLPVLNLTSTNNLTINLCADTGTGPGAVLETLSVDSSIFPHYPAPFSVTTLNSATQPLLNANTIYWITLQPTAPGPSWYSWSQLETIPQLQIMADAYNPYSSAPVPWTAYYGFQNGAAFAVYGTPVPEPSVSAIAFLGMAGFVLGFRKPTRTLSTAAA